MNSKERVKKILAHEEADRIPLFDSMWEDTLTRWIKEGLADEDIFKKPDKGGLVNIFELQENTLALNDYFNFDFDRIYMDASMRFKARVISETEDKITIKDRYGYTVEKVKGKSRTMRFIEFVNKGPETWKKIKDRMNVNFDNLSRIDTESFFLRVGKIPTWEEAKVKFDKLRKRNKFILLSVYGPFEATWRQYGFTNQLTDILLKKDFMQEMYEKYCYLVIDILKKGKEYGIKPDGMFFAEDMGYTNSLLLSPATYKEVLFPFHKMLGDYLRNNSINYFMHSDGKIYDLIPYLIKAGVEVIQPLEAKTGMDVRKLKKEFGKDLTFMGNINVMKLSGSKKDIEEEVISKITVAKKGGGYIYHSDHSIPPEVSLENYKYLISLVKKYGTY